MRARRVRALVAAHAFLHVLEGRVVVAERTQHVALREQSISQRRMYSHKLS